MKNAASIRFVFSKDSCFSIRVVAQLINFWYFIYNSGTESTRKVKIIPFQNVWGWISSVFSSEDVLEK